MACVLGSACFDALPPALKQLVCVSPHHLAIYAETLVLDVCLETFSIDYLVENRVFYRHRSQQDYGLGGGKIGIEGKSRAIVPVLFQFELSGEQVHVGNECLVVSLFGLFLFMPLDDFAHRFGDSHRGIVATWQHQCVQKFINC